VSERLGERGETLELLRHGIVGGAREPTQRGWQLQGHVRERLPGSLDFRPALVRRATIRTHEKARQAATRAVITVARHVPIKAMKDHIETITDLLLGAAYADKRLEGREKDRIHALLAKLVGSSTLPESLDARFKDFSPAAFDAVAAGQRLAGLGNDRRRVLEMIASVTDADEEIDLAEDRYLRTVAEAMGLADKQFRDLVVDFTEIDELEGILGETLGI
jgi:uncharacterized tellurite resistance protein B-like protein